MTSLGGKNVWKTNGMWHIEKSTSFVAERLEVYGSSLGRQVHEYWRVTVIG